MELLMEETNQFSIRDYENGANASGRYSTFWNLWTECEKSASTPDGFNNTQHYGKFSLCVAKSNFLVDDNGMLQKQRAEGLIKGSCIFNSEQERKDYLQQASTSDGKWDNGFLSHCNKSEDQNKLISLGLLGAMRSENRRKELENFMRTLNFKTLFPRFARCGLPNLLNCLSIPNTTAIVGSRTDC